MQRHLQLDDICEIAPAGAYIALRVRFRTPSEEISTLSPEWCAVYAEKRFLAHDPCLNWAARHAGSVPWSTLEADDRVGYFQTARDHGLVHGLTFAVHDVQAPVSFSHAQFCRSDRAFSDIEARLLMAYLKRRHDELAAPVSLTSAEVEALSKVMHGQRLKEIAHDLGVSEGAIKQRLRNAKQKLDARTSTHAVIIAARQGLI